MSGSDSLVPTKRCRISSHSSPIECIAEVRLWMAFDERFFRNGHEIV